MSKNALTSKQSSTAPPARNPNHLTVQLKEGEDPEMKMAEVHTGPYMTNAIAFTKSMRGSLGELDITAITSAMFESALKVKANDTSDVEAMLMNQAIVLNGMFADFSIRSAANRENGHFEASQTYLKLAFKAQNQARMTLESLSNIKNPPVLYAKQANIADMPAWKRDIGRRLDALIAGTVPNLRKAVKWNSPFYGSAGQGQEDGWFLSFHCFTSYIKLAFCRGASLNPLPPGRSKQKHVRYLAIHEDDEIDEAQLTDWVRQAAALPGERM